MFGEGEENAPRHPQFEPLTQLLFERGAEPYDMQVLYNTHFRGDILWLLEQIYAQAVKLERQADWDDPSWHMLDMGGYGCGARYLLGIAIDRNNLELAAWILAHGASPDPPAARIRSLEAHALSGSAAPGPPRDGRAAGPLWGAYASSRCSRARKPSPPRVSASIASRQRRWLQEHPEYLRSTPTMFAAARRDRADVVALLLDLGMSVDVEDDQGTRALHEAAYTDAAGVTALLIERGAAVDPRETRYGNTPLGHAVYGRRQRTIDLLARVSRDVFEPHLDRRGRAPPDSAGRRTGSCQDRRPRRADTAHVAAGR